MNSRQIRLAAKKEAAALMRKRRRESINLPFSEKMSRDDPSTTIKLSEVSTHHNALGHQNKITLSQDIIEKCREAFAKYDVNNDGKIDRHELKAALVSMGYSASDTELRNMMAKIDQNGDNQLDLIEFLRLVQNQKNKQDALSENEKHEINIQGAWKALVDPKTGKMDVKVLRKTLETFDLALDVDTFVRTLDVDQNGFVDFEEFHSLFTEAQK